ncbi:MAG: DUF3305 domain-containing protein [Rhodospirillaceae bacterium]|nr:DUF3305 domain-containing protein [Rhodospirillaceae bacterium]
MDREIRIPVGVIVERRQLASAWADAAWLPVAVLPGPIPAPDGMVLRETEETVQYLAGQATLCLFASDAEAYRFNLDSRTPALYVVLRATKEGPLPVRPHLVTASPYEAQDYLDSGEDIVERVAVPEAIHARLAQFVDAFFVEQPFRKRKRDPDGPDDGDRRGAPIALRPRKRSRGAAHD